MKKEYNHLPHLNLQRSYQFITFRTRESLDSYLINLYRSTEEEKIKYYKIDRYLDSSKNGAFLYGELIDKVKDYDSNIFKIEALSIMPNHIHLLLQQNSSLGNIMRIIKGGSAHIVNKTLNKQGKVWSRDYFDRAIRDNNHYIVAYKYIKNNALKANLIDAERRFYGVWE